MLDIRFSRCYSPPMLTNGTERMSYEQKVKFDAAMTELDAALIRLALQPTWQKAKTQQAIEKAQKVRA